MKQSRFIPKGYIYPHSLGVFAFDGDYHFALLQSNLHEAWVWRQASNLESRNRYTSTDCFETFPFPPLEYGRTNSKVWLEFPDFAAAEQVGRECHEHRRQIMLDRQLGLIKIYNLFHNPACKDNDIETLRILHIEMDRTIAKCYGWEDLDLQHGFYENERGKTRFTISPQARREVLRRLVELNLEIANSEKTNNES